MDNSIKIEKQSSKFIKPFVQTPQTLTPFKLGFIDEFAPDVNVGIVLFFSTNTDQTTNFIARLEKSLEKTLARFYPLAGRYVDKTATIDCDDHGAEFIHAKVNIKLQDFLVYEANVKFIDEFMSSKIGVVLQQSDPLLVVQVTTFECGGVAIGVKATHKIVDASTLSTVINEWAATNRQENDNDNSNEFSRTSFMSSLLFPPRGLCSMPVPPMNNDELNKYTRKKLSFSESVISNLKAKGSKVQLISAIIWKAFMGVDIAVHNHQRESMVIQIVNLRGKMASLIPKTSCGNLFGTCTTECRTHETTEELTDRLSDSVKKCITNFSKVHHDCEEGQTMVLNSLLNLINIRESTCGVIVTSWCKFPFYQVDFGFGKPIWAAPGTIPVNHSAHLMDDVQGNGVEAYVFLQVKDIPLFEEALKHVFTTLY
ncbi:hypothetical protein E3N88_34209 [Mikania micrantha]|uniref:Transferase, Chloramphenicol acetyltransferase-like domain protein n=1 Tax=Mikania micrantha TaxID=192012 RepID=A0A5N6LXF6_9ASTR|nr:hypothetical protein E3N88_34209 [Mikania micrantha]